MLCALSGEIPEEPVVSRKTGIVYEKRLIHKYLEENNGKGPGDEEELDPEDLLPIKTSRVVRPRPPNFTSLPSLLKAFQDEWDALVLESYNTQEQLARTREELATALYQHDAAVRVIARLTKERDEARDALSKVTVRSTDAPAAAGDEMQVDSEGLPEELAAHVDAVHQKLTKGRKKRAIPEGWATSDQISNFKAQTSLQLPAQTGSVLAVTGNNAAVGALEGHVAVFDPSAEPLELRSEFELKEPISAIAWSMENLVIASDTGAVKIYLPDADGPKELAAATGHAGRVMGLAIHPGQKFCASVGLDKAVVFHELTTAERLLRVYSDASLTTCAFHPDGHLLAAGTESGDIKIFETKTGSQAAVFRLGASVRRLAFSENGYFFAATAGPSMPGVVVFDLRKEGDAARAHELLGAETVHDVAWDYSGQFLATAGPMGVTVQVYNKAAKAWSEGARVGMKNVLTVAWGEGARSLVVASAEGTVRVLRP